MLSWCFGRRSSREEREREPLLPQYHEDTSRQARLHEKLHSYQMLKALRRGYMPSNEQTIILLRTLLAADAFSTDLSELSESGRSLVLDLKLWLKQFIEILQHKNSEDQIQDFLWYLTQARLNVDAADIAARASVSKAKADTAATYRSLQTIGSLLLTNSDFRVFLSDVSTIGKEVFRDTALTLSDVSKETAKRIEPSEAERKAVKDVNQTSKPDTSKEDLKNEAKDVAETVINGGVEVVQEAGHSIAEHTGEEEREALLGRLKRAIFKLKDRNDYSDSVSTLSSLVRRYLMIYSHAAMETAQTIEDDVNTNPEADKALKNFWLLLKSFGSGEAWKRVEDSFHSLVEDGRADPQFDELLNKLSTLLQDMLSDPDFYDNAEERFKEVRAKSKELTIESTIRDDVEALIESVLAALHSLSEDSDIHKLIRTTTRIARTLTPAGKYTNEQLVSDSINVFLPMILSAVQYIPIPRLEVSTPGVDLLLENLVLEPGRTVNHSSFLPYKLQFTTQNDVEVRKARTRMTSQMRSLLQIKLSGLSLAAEELGYWMRLRSWLFPLADEGLAGFFLDERGIDITLMVEIGPRSLEEMVKLRKVDVCIHHLNYNLSRSKFAPFAWLLKPLIRPIVRKALEMKIEAGIADGLHTLNRELVYARERFRAARIANAGDMWSFVRAVAARLTPAPDPDLDARVGVYPGKGVFRGRYAPGSLTRVWEREGQEAEHRVYEYEVGGWRNDIFDVSTTRPAAN
ncbi:hypothetical protein HJFPF1_07056 [Paramyrothecium foliicola]|nr:hypothetical protein HJFPF1_07056 [Paramyrothecium foliicola]